MSGGVEAKALIKPKKFFGAARNVEEGGSLNDSGDGVDRDRQPHGRVIFEEFKGTGNMELHLDRALVEKRLYPAIHVLQSATRREELLYHPDEWERVQLLRKTMAALPPIEAMEKLIENLEATKTNAELLLERVAVIATACAAGGAASQIENGSTASRSTPKRTVCIAILKNFVCCNSVLAARLFDRSTRRISIWRRCQRRLAGKEIVLQGADFDLRLCAGI